MIWWWWYDDDDDWWWWWWWWISLKKLRKSHCVEGDLLKVCELSKQSWLYLAGLPRLAQGRVTKTSASWNNSLRFHFLLRSSFIKVPDYFFASLMLLMMIDDLSSERVHDKNIRKVIKHFQKTKSLAGASQNSLKIRYFRIFSSHQKNAIPDKNFVSR